MNTAFGTALIDGEMNRLFYFVPLHSFPEN